MAKKKATRGEFNMSAEIRNLLQGNPNQSSREVFEALQAGFPEQEINRNSCNVAFSHARRKLGIKGGGARAVRRRRPGTRTTTSSVSTSSAAGSFNIELLAAARDLLAKAGSSEAAVQAIKQLQSLQIG